MADTQTVTQLRDLLNKFLAAQDAVLLGQSYSINGLTYTRADAAWISDQIKDLRNSISVRSRRNRASVVFTR